MLSFAEAPRSGPPIQVDANLVLINALVTDRRGVPISNLNTSQFHIFEAGKEQPIRFSMRGDGSASIGIVLDTSGSMGANMERAKAAAIHFLRCINAKDEYALITFQGHPSISLPFTKNLDSLTAAIASLKGRGSTALIDALYLAMRQMHQANYLRKAILVVSDDIDNHSRYTMQEIQRVATEASCPVYTICLPSQASSGNRFSIRRRPDGILDSISRLTGGRNFTVFSTRKLDAIVEQIAAEIEGQYLLGFVAPYFGAPTRRVDLQVDPIGQPLKVTYRRSYQYPGRASRQSVAR
jgi:VWFA-related protein